MTDPVSPRLEVRDVALLINPAAGSGKSLPAAERAAARFAERGVRVHKLVGADPQESGKLARQAVKEGVDALVVVGGDGMIHLVLPALVGTGTPLGMIPAGTGNDQAREYGWPRNSPEQAADIVLDGRRQSIDLGVAVTADGTKSYFGSVLASGFDSLVSDRVNRTAWPHGRARYNVAILVEFINLRPLPFTITLADGTVIEQDALLVAVGNTRSYGGGMLICPAADPTDGLLDVTIAAAASRFRTLGQLPSVYRGTHITRPEIRTLRTSSLRIESPVINAYADGELLGPLPVDVSVLTKGMDVIVSRTPPPRSANYLRSS